MPYKDPEKQLEYSRKYRAANLEKTRRQGLDYYYRSGGYRHKHQTDARKAYMKVYNREHHKKRYQGDIKLEIQEYSRNRRYADWEKVKDAELKVHYGLNLAEYKQILENQNGTCAICKQPETATVKGKIRSLSVDHNHETGKVRGLLCGRCNSSVGLLGEDVNRMQAMIEYITKHNA